MDEDARLFLNDGRLFLFLGWHNMSFEELLTEISPKLKGIVYKISWHLHLSDGDDLYGEAVAHLWEDYMTGKLSGKTNSYILQSCYFFLKNHLRKNGDKVNFVSMDDLISDGVIDLRSFSVFSDEEAEAPSLDENLGEIMEEVFNKELTRKEKEIAFFYIQGWTTREIGERLGISHVSVLKIEDKIREKCKRLKGCKNEKN